MIEWGAVRSTPTNRASGRPSYCSPGTETPGTTTSRSCWPGRRRRPWPWPARHPRLAGGLWGWVRGPGRKRSRSRAFHSYPPEASTTAGGRRARSDDRPARPRVRPPVPPSMAISDGPGLEPRLDPGGKAGLQQRTDQRLPAGHQTPPPPPPLSILAKLFRLAPPRSSSSHGVENLAPPCPPPPPSRMTLAPPLQRWLIEPSHWPGFGQPGHWPG